MKFKVEVGYYDEYENFFFGTEKEAEAFVLGINTATDTPVYQTIIEEATK